MILLLPACVGSLGESGDTHGDDSAAPVVPSYALGDAYGASVVVVVVDTLRADHLPWAGYERDTAPNLTAWGFNAAVWPRATAVASNTGPNIASLWTGLWTQAHGYPVMTATDALADVNILLPELARDNGYATSLIVANNAVTEARGLWQGFASVADLSLEPAEVVVDEALSQLDTLAAPYFLAVHLMDPHASYQAPEPYYEMWDSGGTSKVTGATAEVRAWDNGEAEPSDADIARTVALYDGEITYLDAHLSRLLAAIPGDAVVVFVADHGEQFGEHGEFFHHDEHRENVQVPLAFRVPNAARAVHDANARTIDVAPTLAAIVGLPPVDYWQGVDLEPVLRGAAHPALVTYSERTSTAWSSTDGTGRWALHRESSGVQLWDLDADPGETVDVSDEHGDVVDAMAAEVEAIQTSSAALYADLVAP